jgi:predicted house-cleaning noncanonical NTP pyrophosphatase (MazG superfamily)
VLLAEADGLVREAARDLMREAIRARLKEKLGEHLEAVAHLAVDTLLEDLATSLAVERLIEDRKQQRGAIDERLREIRERMKRP